MTIPEIQFILDNLGEIMVMALVQALKNDPQILEALNEAVKYE